MAEETNPLEELLVDELKDIYSAENQIVKALPKMARAASSPELKRAFERHLEETRNHVERLDQIGEELETKMERAGAVLTSVETALFELLGRAGALRAVVRKRKLP